MACSVFPRGSRELPVRLDKTLGLGAAALPSSIDLTNAACFSRPRSRIHGQRVRCTRRQSLRSTTSIYSRFALDCARHVAHFTRRRRPCTSSRCASCGHCAPICLRSVRLVSIRGGESSVAN